MPSMSALVSPMYCIPAVKAAAAAIRPTTSHIPSPVPRKNFLTASVTFGRTAIIPMAVPINMDTGTEISGITATCLLPSTSNTSGIIGMIAYK